MIELENLDWTFILEQLTKSVTSELARNQIQKISPFSQQSDAEKSLRMIEEMRPVLEQGSRPFMESLDLFHLWFSRLEKSATLKPLELKDLRHFLIEVHALKEILSPFNEPWISKIKEEILDAEEPLSAIDQLMTPQGEIKTDASENLYQLYQSKKQINQEIQGTLDRLIKQHELESILQDRYVTTREGRWVVPVRSGMQGRFEGIIHASSQSKQTVFMEPKEVLAQNNRLREIEVAIEEEIERLLQQLTQYLTQKTEEIEATKDILLECDVRLGQAHLAQQLQANSPLFSSENIELLECRHPILILQQAKAIGNSVHLNRKERILLLSGPNAGGKTVLLKSIGLAAQMARCGLPICAEAGSRLPFFRQLHVAVGDSQNVDSHLSTFAGHLKILNSAAQSTGFDQLLLIDEICGATDPEEGSALARAFIQSYAENSVFAVITSHLGPLKSGWEQESGLVHGSLEYDIESSQPTYQLIMGIPGQSLAIQTARRIGVMTKIVEQALLHLSPQQRFLQQKIEDLEVSNNEMEKIKKRLQHEFRETQKARSKYEALVQKFQREKESMLEQVIKRAEKKVENMIELAQANEIFKKHESLQKIKYQLPEVIKASSSGSQSKIEDAENFAQHFPPGSRVFVTSVGRDAVVQGLPNAKGEVPILSQSMRLLVPWQSLRSPQQIQNPTVEVIRKAAQFTYSGKEGDRVVDIRGFTVEEALNHLEIQLDTAALNKEERIKIVHGHGTDALKRAIRSYLSRSVYVKKWTGGTKDSGGDGVTWTEIND